jgi:hypothetical protein
VYPEWRRRDIHIADNSQSALRRFSRANLADLGPCFQSPRPECFWALEAGHLSLSLYESQCAYVVEDHVGGGNEEQRTSTCQQAGTAAARLYIWKALRRRCNHPDDPLRHSELHITLFAWPRQNLSRSFPSNIKYEHVVDQPVYLQCLTTTREKDYKDVGLLRLIDRYKDHVNLICASTWSAMKIMRVSPIAL